MIAPILEMQKAKGHCVPLWPSTDGPKDMVTGSDTPGSSKSEAAKQEVSSCVSIRESKAYKFLLELLMLKRIFAGCYNNRLRKTCHLNPVTVP